MIEGMGRLLDEIRAAIEASDKTRYRIAKESGVAESALSRLMSGERGLSIDAAESLAASLRLKIALKRRTGERGGK